jgi:hypothetical protein
MRIAALAVASLIAGAAASAGPAAAQSQVPLALVDASRPGLIDAALFGPVGSEVRLGELVDGRIVPLTSAVIPPEGNVFLQSVSVWRCDRQIRRLVPSVTAPEGELQGPTYVLRTPSCRGRFDFAVPDYIRPGRRGRATLRDTWRIGDVDAKLCIAPPGRRASCRDFALAAGEPRASLSFRPRRLGIWRLELRTSGLKLERSVYVAPRDRFRRRKREDLPVVLITGNSLMQTLDSLVIDKLGERAEAVSDVRIATGLTVRGTESLVRARREARRRKPDATVVFYGGPDGFDLPTAGGETVSCCGEDWIDAYARRAREVMLAYGREGEGSVLWLTMPAPRREDHRQIAFAANQGARRAAELVANVRIVALDRIFTPGFRYREFMRRGGRRVRVRGGDGVHLTLPGARIAASVVFRRLTRLGLFRG